ncbi:MAG: hypothetical protein ABI963_12790, partial [Rhizomicrobium sp.]
ARDVPNEGSDPAIQARVAKLTRAVAAANTFDLVADEYLEKYEREGRAVMTVIKAKWLFDFARPSLGTRPIAEIIANNEHANTREFRKFPRRDRSRYPFAKSLRNCHAPVNVSVDR